MYQLPKPFTSLAFTDYLILRKCMWRASPMKRLSLTQSKWRRMRAKIKCRMKQSRLGPFILLDDQIIGHPHRRSTLSQSAALELSLSHESARNIQAKRWVKVVMRKPFLRAMARVHVDQ